MKRCDFQVVQSIRRQSRGEDRLSLKFSVNTDIVGRGRLRQKQRVVKKA